MTGPARLATLGVGLVLVAAVAVGVPTAFTAASSTAMIGAATGRTLGVIVSSGPDRVTVRWAPPGEAVRDTDVALASGPPAVGTRTEVAWVPGHPATAFVPGAELMAGADRAVGLLAVIAAVLVVVLGVTAAQLLARRRAVRRPTTPLAVRRVRVESGPIARSWLETADERWIPVHYDPVLTVLPAPAQVAVHGDPARHRLLPVEVDGRTLWPSGPVSAREPRGRRHDNPAGPDGHAPQRAERLDRLTRRLRVLLPLAAPAPVVALVWTWVDGGSVVSWLATSLLLAALALWWGSLRGIDPT